MKKSEVIEILEEAMKGKPIDHMTIGEMKEAMIVLTSIIIGMLLISNKPVDEIKKIIKS